MNFCKDCKYKGESKVFKTDPEYWVCNSPKNSKGINSLTGEPVKIYRYCVLLRQEKEYCGVDGDWFERIDNVVPE